MPLILYLSSSYEQIRAEIASLTFFVKIVALVLCQSQSQGCNRTVNRSMIHLNHLHSTMLFHDYLKLAHLTTRDH